MQGQLVHRHQERCTVAFSNARPKLKSGLCPDRPQSAKNQQVPVLPVSAYAQGWDDAAPRDRRHILSGRCPFEPSPHMLPWLRGAIPIKSHFEQVHRVSFDHESNLLKTPFERSRWRGGRYACDTPNIMGFRSVLNRLSPILLIRLPSACCRRKSIQFP
jgi:hypothetical protein